MSDFCPAVGNPPPCLKFHVARKAGKLNCTLGVLIPFAMLTSTLRLRRHDFENVELNVQNPDGESSLLGRLQLQTANNLSGFVFFHARLRTG